MASRPLDPQKIVAEIRIGRLDLHCDDIFQAILKRAADTQGRFAWRIEWTAHDLVITEDDLTLDECMAVEKFAQTTWHELNPFDSAEHAGVVMIVVLSRRRDVPLDDAIKQVGALGASEVKAMVDKYFVEPSPLNQEGTELDGEGNPVPLS